MVDEFSAAIQSWRRKDAASRENLLKSLRSLATFYPSHIWKEDYLLFPLAAKFLTPEDQRELAEKFESVEQEIGHDVHARMHRLADELEQYTSSGGSC